VAERQGCMKECISGVAFTDVVIDTFFGFSPSVDGRTLLVDPDVPRPFTAELINVRAQRGLTTIVADQGGVKIGT
jgi:hypothetical protein